MSLAVNELKEICIRKAEASELTTLRVIYDSAKSYMDKTGNPNQWAVGYPSSEALRADIECGRLYVMCQKSDNVPHAVFAMIPGADPTYSVIDGRWLNDEPYVAIHRVASDGFFRGVVKTITEYTQSCFGGSDIRIDTHADNLPMQNALKSNGYAYCGVIKLQNGSPRNAYQLLGK